MAKKIKKTDEINQLYSEFTDVCINGDPNDKTHFRESIQACVQWCENNLDRDTHEVTLLISKQTLLVFRPLATASWDRLKFINLQSAKINAEVLNRRAAKAVAKS